MHISPDAVPLSGRTVFQAQIPSRLSLISALAKRLTSEAIEAGLVASAERDRYIACFEEVLENAVVHGNGNNQKLFVYVRLFYDDTEWGLVVEDQGGGFPSSDPSGTAHRIHPRQERGRGIFLMKLVMDEVRFFKGGRAVVLTKEVDSL